MKLLVVVGVKSFEEKIKDIFESANISIYSKSNISGHKDLVNEELGENWFALSNETRKSVMFFSFTRSEKANDVLKLIKGYNETIDSKSRLKGFVMSVESHT